MGSQLLESSCACASRGCSSLSRVSQVCCSVSKHFFHPTESSREAAAQCLHMYLILVVLPSVCTFKIFGFQLSFMCFPDEFLLIFSLQGVVLFFTFHTFLLCSWLCFELVPTIICSATIKLSVTLFYSLKKRKLNGFDSLYVITEGTKFCVTCVYFMFKPTVS